MAGFEDQPTAAAAAWVIAVKLDGEWSEISGGVNLMTLETPPRSAYTAELYAIWWVMRHVPARQLMVVSDSLSALQFLENKKRYHEKDLLHLSHIPYYLDIKALERARLEGGSHYVYRHIYSHMKEKLDKDFDTWAPKIMKQRQLYTADESNLATRGNQKADDLAKNI
jgi:hypothetical protein